MAKSTHDKQLQRARDKRRQDSLAKRRSRSRVIVIVLVALLALSLVGGALLASRDTGTPTIEDDPDTAAATGEDAGEEGGDDPADAEAEGDEEAEELAAGERPEGACEPTPDDVPGVDSQLYEAPPEVTIDEDATYTATLATTCGDVVIELDAAGAPVTVNNFVFLAEEGYYDGVGFHRVIEDFMIQGGDPAGTGCGKEDCMSPGGEAFPGYTFDDELGPAAELVEAEGGYTAGTVAMANAGPNTNGSQFFIVEAGEPYPLPPDYTVFGRVVEGMDVVEAIALGPVAGDQAADPVVITSVAIETS